MKAAHHSGTYAATSEAVRLAANTNPRAICWRDGLTLEQHAPHKDGSRPTWTGGHTVRGWKNSPAWLHVTRRPPPGPWIAPEASTCNYSDGGAQGLRLRRNPNSERWFDA